MALHLLRFAAALDSALIAELVYISQAQPRFLSELRRGDFIDGIGDYWLAALDFKIAVAERDDHGLKTHRGFFELNHWRFGWRDFLRAFGVAWHLGSTL